MQLRPVRSSDAEALRRFHESLSLATIRKRFFSPHPTLSAAELRRFTTVDHHAREAVVALDGDDIVAVGRYDSSTDGVEAEVAFVVRDDWQGRGAATALLATLGDAARREGIDRFTASTLYDNQAMLSVFRNSGWLTEVSYDAGVVEVTLSLAVRPDR